MVASPRHFVPGFTELSIELSTQPGVVHLRRRHYSKAVFAVSCGVAPQKERVELQGRSVHPAAIRNGFGWEAHFQTPI